MIAPSYVAQNVTVASHNMEKPLYQIPKRRLCCALSRGFSTLREKFPKGGERHLEKSYSNLHEFYFNVVFSYLRIKLKNPRFLFRLVFKSTKANKPTPQYLNIDPSILL